MDWTMVAFEVPAGHAPAAISAARTLGISGLMVTMPHKAEVIDALDDLTESARELGAVNSIYWSGEQLVGHNTDGEGLVRSLQLDRGYQVIGQRCAVIGAGGAARSVVHALAQGEASEVVVVNRTPERAEIAATLAGSRGRVGSPADIAEVDLVVNATSVGMGASADAVDPTPFDPGLLHPDQVVVDLVYQPLETPLLRAARRMGATAVDGLGMLVHQAALTIERWTGQEPDIEAMAAAARRSL